VLVYALELRGGGVALVDAGWDTDDAWMALNDGLAAAGGSISDVRAVMVTHIHPDHYGLAGRIREASGAWIGLHPADAVMIDGRYGDTDELLAAMWHLLVDSGVPEDLLPDLNFASMIMKSNVNLAKPDVLFEDGKEIELPGWSLRTIWTPGHSPGHVCFYSDDQKLLLSGDHVLPRITPNISVHTQQVANPLGNYLESLAKLQDLETDEVLPAHSTGSPTFRLDSTSSWPTMRTASTKSRKWSSATTDAPPGRSPSSCTGPDRGIRSSRSCSGRRTVRRWLTAWSWSCRGASDVKGACLPGSSR
jgi:glyoxylase-like metal-dependent hydrolase (beta-lactamase superfamily II)